MVREEKAKSRLGYPLKPPELPVLTDPKDILRYIQECNHMYIMTAKIIQGYQHKVDQLENKEKDDPI